MLLKKTNENKFNMIKQKEKSWSVFGKGRLNSYKFLEFEDFKATIKNMKNQGKEDFFIGRSIKTIIMKRKKRKEIKAKISNEEEEKRQRNTMQKLQRKKDDEAERMLNLWELYWWEVRWAGESFRTNALLGEFKASELI